MELQRNTQLTKIFIEFEKESEEIINIGKRENWAEYSFGYHNNFLHS